MVLVVAAVATLLSGCRQEESTITAVRIIAKFGQQPIEQLEFSLLAPMSPLTIKPTRRPGVAGAPLDSPASFVYYIDDDRAGRAVTCRAKGYAAGKVVARGGKTITPVLNQVANCEITLDVARADDDGQDTDGCADGAREAFLDASQAGFPRVAACAFESGSLASYGAAKNSVATQCQAGWHWCTLDTIGNQPPLPQPTWVKPEESVCIWLDREVATCEGHQSEVFYGSDNCTLFKVATGTVTGTDPCDVLPAPGLMPAMIPCGQAFRAVVRLGTVDILNKPHSLWSITSVKDDMVCRAHVSAACATDPNQMTSGNTKGESCLLGCCKD